MANKKNQTAVSDEEIIAALLQSGSIAQAAELTGISPRTVYDRMGDRSFKSAYSAAKSDIIRAAVLSMNRSLSTAIDVINAIMNDENANPATRLQAAKMILENAARFADRLKVSDTETGMWAESPFNVNPAKW